MEHVKEGKHGAKSARQAVAIGLSKARRAGVELPPPQKGRAKDSTRRKAARDVERGQETGALAGVSEKTARTSSARSTKPATRRNKTAPRDVAKTTTQATRKNAGARGAK